MSEVYTGIDLGTNNIKIVVLEKIRSKFHVLASVSSVSAGICNGQIVDTKKAVMSVRKAVKKASDMLGFKITKVIAVVPPTDCSMDIVLGSSEVIDPNEIKGTDISNVLQDALIGQIKEEFELVTAIPISFTIDDKENIRDPKGMRGKLLETKLVITTIPKEPLYRILEVLKLSGLETVDVAFTSTGDYYSIKSKSLQTEVGAIINIGEISTNISIFNKGIQIKNSLLPIGSKNVDKDICYIFKIKDKDSRQVKETFAVSLQAYADSNDVYEISLDEGQKKEISQVGVSKVVEARVREILNLSKNEIKNLTNREISYIIVTGGLSELAGFQYIVDEILGVKAKVCNINTMGIRHNKYSSVVGGIQYFDDKMTLRGKPCSMMSDQDIHSMISPEEKTINNDNIISKVFGHFFDN